jgi:hypothetical protein
MKKLKLKLKGVGEILAKEQLKKITGGYSVCGAHCIQANGCGNIPNDCQKCGRTLEHPLSDVCHF